MDGISEEELTDFYGKLDVFRQSLDERQRLLLDAILKIAWNKAMTPECLEQEFNGAFTPDQADLILKYSGGEVDMIEGVVGGNMIKSGPLMIKPGPQPGFIK
jgi:hypothetical protein